MREILFTGKSRDTGKWYQGDLVTVAHKRFIDDDIVKERVHPESVGQFTGLTDYSEDRKKIFEGHIIKCRHVWTGNKKDVIFRFADDIFSVPIIDENEMQEAFEEQKIKGAYGKHTGENDLGKCFYYYRNYFVEYYAPNGRYRLRNGSVFYDLTLNLIVNRKAIIIGNVIDNPELLGGDAE